MTHKDILESIEQVKAMPLTDNTAYILVNLFYIEERWFQKMHSELVHDEWNKPAENMPMSIAIAEEWCAHLENEDGTVGPHWSKERIQHEITQRGICCDLAEFWAIINAIYSDDCAVAKKHNVSTMDYYIDRAKAWLHDKDAVSDKAAAYYHYVVRH